MHYNNRRVLCYIALFNTLIRSIIFWPIHSVRIALTFMWYKKGCRVIVEQKVWVCGEPVRVRKGKSQRLLNIWGIPVAQGDTDVNAIGSPFPSDLSWKEGVLCENSTDWPMRKHPREAIIIPSGTENYIIKSLEAGRCLMKPEGKNFSTLPVTSWWTERCLFFCIIWKSCLT